jgi:hypothetical protein
MSRTTRLRAVLLCLAAFLLVVQFYGPLFAWSPITPGFVRTEVGGLLYLQRVDRSLTEEHRRASASVGALETHLGLRFNGPVRVVLCDEPGDFRRFMPWLPAPAGLGARTLQLDTTVFVAPLVRNRPDVGDFIRHELVHVLLLRNTSMVSRLTISRHWWVIEGLSVHLGNAGSYVMPTGDRHARLAPALAAILDPDGARGAGGATIAERYALAGAFVGHLLERHGLDSWRGFLHAYLANPSEWRTLFARQFGPFEAAVDAFASARQSSALAPPSRSAR